MPDKKAIVIIGKKRYWLLLAICVIAVISSIFLELAPNPVKSAMGVGWIAALGTISIIAFCGGAGWSLSKILFGRERKNDE